MVTLVLLGLAGAAAVWTLRGIEISAPDGIRDTISQRINRDLGAVQLDFGSMAFALEEDWVPRLRLRDVAVRDAEGMTLVSLSDVGTTVDLGALLRRQIRPDTIRLSGAQVVLRRAEDGTLDLSIGQAGPAVRQAASIAALIGQLDDLLLRPQSAQLEHIEADNLTIRYEDARAGRAWSVDGGRLALSRQGDDLQIRGDMSLLGARAFATSIDMSYSGRIGETAAEFGMSFEDMPARDIAGQSPALAWLEALDAPISGALRGSVDAVGKLGPLNATLQIGAGVLQPTEATKPIAFSSVRSYLTYEPEAQMITFSELALQSSWVSARAEGQAILVGMEKGWPEELLGQIRVSEIIANPADLYPEPVELAAAAMDLRLKLDPFVLSLGQMSLADQDRRLVLDGELRAAPEGWDLALNGRMDKLTPERLLQLWPPKVKQKTRAWIEENVVDADLSNIQLAVRSVPGAPPAVFLGFDFDRLETRFVKQVPHIRDASGHASLYDERFVISAATGHVMAAQGGRINIAGTSFIIPNVRIRRGPALARLRTDSTITAALSLLDEEPFRFLQKAGQPVTLAGGRAQLDGRLDLLLKPKLTPQEVAFNVTGTLSDVRSETLVPGRALVAPTLTVKAANDSLSVGGEGRLGGVPVQGTWASKLGPEAEGRSQVTGWIELSERFANEFRIGLPAGSLSGAGRADIEIDLVRDKPGRFALRSDLAGVGLNLRQLGWRLPPASRGQLEVAGELGQPPVIDRVSLSGAGLSAEGAVRLRENGQLDRASFSRVQVGDWLDAPVTLVGRGPGRTPAVEVSGGRIDLRQTSLSGDGQGGSGGTRKQGAPVRLALDRLQISDGMALTGFRADLSTEGGTSGNFTGRVNDGPTINGTIVPQGGRSAFRVTSDNAGGVLRSAGLLKNAREGKLDLVLTPAPGPGSYDGQLKAQGMRVQNTPALAALLNALSVVGILDQLSGDGIHFSEVDARFRLSPERLTLLSGSAVGASMGISMDGYYYMASKQMDMQGVISPVYLVNGIGGIFTRRGEGLFGFNYSLKGPASAPSVQVNPLSVFTPGMFRELFRRPPPQVRQQRPETGAAPPPEKPADRQRTFDR